MHKLLTHEASRSAVRCIFASACSFMATFRFARRTIAVAANCVCDWRNRFCTGSRCERALVVESYPHYLCAIGCDSWHASHSPGVVSLWTDHPPTVLPRRTIRPGPALSIKPCGNCRPLPNHCQTKTNPVHRPWRRNWQRCIPVGTKLSGHTCLWNRECSRQLANWLPAHTRQKKLPLALGRHMENRPQPLQHCLCVPIPSPHDKALGKSPQRNASRQPPH